MLQFAPMEHTDVCTLPMVVAAMVYMPSSIFYAAAKGAFSASPYGCMSATCLLFDVEDVLAQGGCHGRSTWASFWGSFSTSTFGILIGGYHLVFMEDTEFKPFYFT